MNAHNKGRFQNASGGQRMATGPQWPYEFKLERPNDPHTGSKNFMRQPIDELMKRSHVSFGTSGIRGLVTEMTDTVCYSYVKAFLQYVDELYENSLKSPTFLTEHKTGRKVALSGDFRPSTSRILRAIVRAVQDQGFLPVDCGRFPTPVLGLYAIEQGIPGIMVTGSHVAEDRNGMKFFLAAGEILKRDEQAIRNQWVEQTSSEMFDETGGLRRVFYPDCVASDRGDAAHVYYTRYTHVFPENCLQGVRIGFFEHSTVAGGLLGDLYESLGAEVVRLGRTEGFVAIDTEAFSPDLLAEIRAQSEAGGFDAILSADGDGDRPLIFDEKGEMVPGDIAGVITAMFLNADTVVTPVTSSTVLEKTGFFSKIIRTKIGSPYVVEAMEQAKREETGKTVAGYEANGGFLTGTPFFLHDRFQKMGFSPSKTPILAPLPTRDPAIVHLSVLLMARHLKKPCSAFRQMLPERVTQSGRITDFPVSLATEKLSELQEHQDGRFLFIESEFGRFGKLTGVDLTDGVRMTFDEMNIVHVRISGNAPELRCYIEAENSENAEKLLYQSLKIFETWR